MTTETKPARSVRATDEPDWRVCDAREICGRPVDWRVRVFDRSGWQILFNLYACVVHRRTIEAEARRRDD